MTTLPPDKTAKLFGFGLSGYRSFGKNPPDLIGPLSKLTFLAGQNNAGKSNTLQIINKLLRRNYTWEDELDYAQFPAQSSRERLQLHLAFRPTDSEQVLTKIRDSYMGAEVIDAIFEDPQVKKQGEDLAWFVYESVASLGTQSRWELSDVWLRSLRAHSSVSLDQASAALTGTVSGDPLGNLHAVLGEFDPLGQLPEVKVIDALRQIDTGEFSKRYTPDGRPLIEALRRLERPSALNQHHKEMFSAVNSFVRSVTGEPTAQLEVSTEPEELLISVDERTLPLRNYGTGIQQVVILAAVATLYENYLICIEEPEVNLHPLLQRKLVRYLSASTSNQYIITTHSAHMLDMPTSTVVHVERTQEGSRLSTAANPEALSQIASDLGYRPSDLLQANAVVWVEGPSDRIYIRHWLAMAAPELLEHIHFSIMFYGGRLLSHLTADDEEVGDFIRLTRLNRSLVVLMDSDKKSAHRTINNTKKRVIAELEARHSGFAWLTWGRTIENYAPLSILQPAFTKLFGNVITAWDRFDDLAEVGGKSNFDKVKLAREVCASWGERTQGPGDLKLKIDKLATFIRAANPSEIEP